MQVSWKSGSKKELRTGRKTKALRRTEKRDNWSLNTNRLRSIVTLQSKRLMRLIKKLMMALVNLRKLLKVWASTLRLERRMLKEQL